MDNLHGIVVFLRVVDAGSLSSAARSLGVSVSAVSAALARLEDRLSTRLVNRTTRRLNVTQEGAEFYERCKKVVKDLEAAELTVKHAGRVPSGTLRVGLPSGLGGKWIVPKLGEFVDAYPSISLEIVCTDFVPLSMGEGLDVAVQIGALHDSTLSARRLACPEYVVCASPQYLAARGTPKSPLELEKHRCLTYRRPRNGRLWNWRFRVDGEIRTLTIEGLVTINSHEALVSAAAAGLGIIQVAEYYAHSEIERGGLVEILNAFKTEGHIISAVFSKQKPFPPKIRVFVDFLVQQFNSPPWTESKKAPPVRAIGKDRPAPRAKISHAQSRSASNNKRSVRGQKPNARA